jgi:hypothetical protein
MNRLFLQGSRGKKRKKKMVSTMFQGTKKKLSIKVATPPLRMLPEISQADSLSFRRIGCNVYK